MPHLDDGRPRAEQSDPDELIEAGSLSYFAMSRANDQLFISYAVTPSLFIEALLPHVDIGATS